MAVTSPRPGSPACSTVVCPAGSCVGKIPSITPGSSGASVGGGTHARQASTAAPAAIKRFPEYIRSPLRELPSSRCLLQRDDARGCALIHDFPVPCPTLPAIEERI